MTDPEVDLDATVSAVCALMLAVERFGRVSAVRAGIGVTAAAVVYQVSAAGGAQVPARVSRQLLLGSGTLTAILDRLVTAAYLTRCPNPADGRSILVAIQPAGRRFVAGADRDLSTVISAALPGLAGAHLTTLLNRLARVLNAEADELSKPPTD